jgi:hypothetical protein
VRAIREIFVIAERGLSLLVDSDDDCLLTAPPSRAAKRRNSARLFARPVRSAVAEFENPSFHRAFRTQAIKSPPSKRINTNGPSAGGALRPLWDLCRTGIRHLVQTGSSVDRSHCVNRSLSSFLKLELLSS